MQVLWFLSLVLAFHFSVESSSIFSSQLNEGWENYKVKYERQYGAVEEGARRLIWEKNIHLINKHNLEADMGKHTYWMGINRFTDWTIEEWNRVRNCAMTAHNATKLGDKSFVSKFNPILPNSVDWREKGYVTEVKDQQQCGSCWAFSSTGSLEGQHKAVSGNLVSLSEQNLVDCSRKTGNQGCDGGEMTYAFEYVMMNQGIDTEDSYPYIGMDSDCKFNPSTVGATCKSYANISPGESNLQAAVSTVGPISVAIDANDNFMHYKSGVFYDPGCSSDPRDLDHAVLVVGYGTEGDSDYWIVKNSWGKLWGQGGYILMSRNRDNNCGIASFASYPIM